MKKTFASCWSICALKRSLPKSDVDVFYSKLKFILGLWSAEDNRLDIAPLAKTFTAMGKELEKLAKILSGHETGLREIHDIGIVSQLATSSHLTPRSVRVGKRIN